jgi:multidrug efflux pump subunit AcrA (membrane-fusion protein)
MKFKSLLMIALAAIALAGCGNIAQPSSQALPTVVLDENKAAATSQTPATSSSVNGGVTASGVVVPAQQVQIVSTLAESVKTVDVSVGDQVSAGQVLLRLDDGALQAQHAQAKAALAATQADYDLLAAGPTAEQVRQAEAALMAATANYSRTVSGARPADIAAAQAAFNAANEAYQKVIAGPEHEDIASAEANFRSAEAAVKQAQTKYDDAYRRDPASIGASPAALELEQATNAYIAAKALYDKAAKPADQAQVSAALQQVESARAALERARRPASTFDIAQAQAQVEEAQAQLDALRAGPRSQQLDAAKAQVAAAQAQVQAIETQMKKLILQAPIAGTVSKLDIHAGEWVTPGQLVAVLADLDHLRVETTDLSERDIPKVKLGQPVMVLIKALNQDVAGRVSEISPLADTLGGDVVYKTTIDLDKRLADLRAGMSVEVQFGEG